MTIEEHHEQQMACPECGDVFLEYSAYCPSCGYPLTYSATPPILKASVFPVDKTIFTMTDLDIMSIVSRPTTYFKGIPYANALHIQTFYYDDSKGTIYAKIQGRNLYITELSLQKNGKISNYHCTCPAYHKYPKACKHIVALCVFIQKGAYIMP